MDWVFLGLSGEVWAVIGLAGGILGVNAANGGNLTYGLVKSLSSRRHRRQIDLPNRIIRRKVVGRDADVAKLRDLLLSGGSGVITPVPAVTGGRGVGKTTLARHYSQSHAADYDRREFIRAETEDSLMRDLAGLADRIEGDSPLVPLDQRAHRALELITAHTKSETWLIIFDNVTAPSALGKWMPQGRKLHVLVTSRHPDWRGNAYETYRVGLLSPEASVALLEQEAGRSDPEMARLARELGYLPLALVQVGEWLAANPRKSVQDYLARLDDYLEERTEDPDREYDRSTGAVVRLTLDTLSKDARAMMGILCWFAPEEITPAPFELLGKKPWLLRIARRNWPIPSRIWSISRNDRRLDAVFAELRMKALLEDGVEADDPLRMHRMSQRMTRGALERGARPDRVAALLAAVYPAGEHGVKNSASWPDCRRLTPHVRALWDSGKAPEVAAMDYLLNQAGGFLRLIADYDGGAEMARASLALTEARLPEADRDVAVRYANLGAALERLGDLDGAEAALCRAEALHGEHRPASRELAEVMEMLGGVLLERGRRGDRAALIDALRQYQRAAALWRRLVPRDSDDRASVLNSLGTVRFALGQGAAALRLYGYALAIRRRVLPPGDARLGYGLLNTGALALRAGAAARAEPLLEEALALWQGAYVEAPRHPDIVTAAQWLVACLLVLARAREDRDGRMDRARKLCAEFGFDFSEMQAHAAQIPYDAAGGAP